MNQERIERSRRAKTHFPTSMASTMQKLLRKSPETRLFSALHRQSELNITLPLTFQQPHNIETKPDAHLGHIPILKPFLGAEKPEKLSPFSQIYPSFPFGFCLNPVPVSGSVPSEAEDVAVDDSREVWADSTKKKRKRKMNRHKYKKLRKRLRRQT